MTSTLQYCEKRFIRREPIFVDKPNGELMNPMKCVFIFNYATTLMKPRFFFYLHIIIFWKFDIHERHDIAEILLKLVLNTNISII